MLAGVGNVHSHLKSVNGFRESSDRGFASSLKNLEKERENPGEDIAIGHITKGGCVCGNKGRFGYVVISQDTAE